MKVKGREFAKKEKIAVGEIYEPTGEVIEKGFNAEWGGHSFTYEEVESMLRGDAIEITTSKGNEVTGKLKKDTYKGYEYWGFSAEPSDSKEKVAVGCTYEPTGEVLEKGFNAEWGGHSFSEYEVERLLRGEEIVVVTSSDTPVAGILAKKTYKGHEYWGFNSGIPNTLAGHVFTAEEKELMYRGESVEANDFWSSKKASYYPARVSWDWDNLEVVMEFGSADEETEEYEEETGEYEEEDAGDDEYI